MSKHCLSQYCTRLLLLLLSNTFYLWLNISVKKIYSKIFVTFEIMSDFWVEVTCFVAQSKLSIDDILG